MNIWKATSFVLASILVSLLMREAYWHRRWQDESIFYLRVKQNAILLYLQKHP